MPRRYRLRFVYEKKNCSVSIDTLQFIIESKFYVVGKLHFVVPTLMLDFRDFHTGKRVFCITLNLNVTS